MHRLVLPLLLWCTIWIWRLLIHFRLQPHIPGANELNIYQQNNTMSGSIVSNIKKSCRIKIYVDTNTPDWCADFVWIPLQRNCDTGGETLWLYVTTSWMRLQETLQRTGCPVNDDIGLHKIRWPSQFVYVITLLCRVNRVGVLWFKDSALLVP